MKIDVNIPVILRVEDYHDIDYYGKILKTFIPEIKWKELLREDFNEYVPYLGLYYIGDIPTEDEIKDILQHPKEKVYNGR